MISIVMPAYNSAAVVEMALRSVKGQSILQEGREGREEIEIIVVDDCSTDGTGEIVRRIAADIRQNDPCVASSGLCRAGGLAADKAYAPTVVGAASVANTLRLICMDKNSGPAAARNRGIKEAQGEWIAFLDADDEWLPGKLEMQMRMIAEHPEVDFWCGEVAPQLPQTTDYTGGDRSAEDGPPRSTLRHREKTTLFHESEAEASARFVKRSSPCLRDLCGEDPASHFLRLEDFVTANPVATSTVMVRKRVLEEVGGFDERFRGPEDYDLWMRIAGHCLEHRAESIEDGGRESEVRDQRSELGCQQKEDVQPQSTRRYGEEDMFHESEAEQSARFVKRLSLCLSDLRGQVSAAPCPMHHALCSLPVAAVAGAVWVNPAPEFTDERGGYVNLLGEPVQVTHRSEKAPREVDWALTTNMAVRKDVYLEVGGIAEVFGIYDEDVDLGLKIRRALYRIVFQPGSAVYHYFLKRGPKQVTMSSEFRLGRNRSIMLVRNFGLLSRVLLFLVTSSWIRLWSEVVYSKKRAFLRLPCIAAYALGTWKGVVDGLCHPISRDKI